MFRFVTEIEVKAILILCYWAVFATGSNGQDVDRQVDFGRDVQPLLSDRCFVCHGPDEASNKSGIRLDIEEKAIDAGVWVPGNPDKSSLLDRIMDEDPDYLMPPPDSGLRLSEEEIEILKKWIEQGAKYESHWAFRPLPAEVPVPENSFGARNEIDRFIQDRLRREKVQSAGEAEKWRWLRRVTFDLTGLPPTEQEIAEFEADESSSAYAKVVDRLLASSDFGRHFATAWLDVARYADSYGYQSDQLSPTWPYRDWVVRALNENLFYDKFLTYQIAGDLLPNATSDQQLATAFNRLHRQTNEGGSVQLEWKTEYVADRVNTFGTAFLGMTVECARCHDHKFDPFSHQDYYNLFAFFNNVDEWGTYHDSSRVPTPTLLLPSAGQSAAIEELETKLAEVRLKLAEQEAALVGKPLTEWLASRRDPIPQPIPIASWKLDEYQNGQLKNDIEGGPAATSSAVNQIVEGRLSGGLKLTGDDPANFPVPSGLKPWDQYSIAFWLLIPDGLKDGVILHRQGGTDVGNFGTEVSLRDDRLLFAKKRFWPGNALAVETKFKLPRNEWFHVVVSNQATGSAKGMNVYVNGEDTTRIVRDHLTKAPAVGGQGFTVGQRFRSPGFKGGVIDEVRFFDHSMSKAEVFLLARSRESLELTETPRETLASYFVRSNEEHQKLMAEQAGLVRKLLQARLPVVETMVMKELPEIRPAYVLARGSYDSPRTPDNVAERLAPSALPAFDKSLPKNRLGLAQWLVDDRHPLTARVAVNRIWQSFFGTGLVASSNDFGLQGAPPSHPELLDWLARDFVVNGWNLKQLCRKIVLSATYRQTSTIDQEMRQRDPENRLLARGPASRLTGEMVRDMALKASGLLRERKGGPPVSPYQPVNLWRESNSMTPAYRQSVGEGLYHRSVYSVWKRTAPLPNMLSFDAVGREVCTVRRTTTNTPLQAFVLLNDPQFVEAARALADSVFAKGDLTQSFQAMFVRLAGRQARENELTLLGKIYDEQVAIFAKAPADAEKFIAVGASTPSGKNDDVELAAMTVVAQAIMNSDAAIWKR